MAAPRVTIRTTDITVKPAPQMTFYGGIVIPSNKGPLTPQLYASQDAFLRDFSPNGKVPADGDIAFYSALNFLRGAQGLYAVRAAHDDALLAGVKIVKETGSAINATLATGLAEVDDFDFSGAADFALVLAGKNPGAWGNDLAVRINVKRAFAEVTDIAAVSGDVTQIADSGWETGEAVRIRKNGSTAVPSPFVEGNTYYAIRGRGRVATLSAAPVAAGAGYSVGDVLSLATPLNGITAKTTVASIAATGTLKTVTLNASGSGYTSGTQELTIVQAGASNGKISVEVVNGAVVSINSITGVGAAYAVANTLATTGGGGTGAKVNITAIAGAVATVATTPTVGGAGYTTGTKTTTVTPAGGSGCTLNVATLESAVGLQLAATVAGAVAGTAIIPSVAIVGTSFYLDPVVIVRDAYTFQLEVVKISTGAVLETIIASTLNTLYDRFGNNLFIEERLSSSNYLQGYFNASYTTAGAPLRAQPVALALTKGDDGSAVEEADVVAAATLFANPEFPIKLLMDGGYDGETLKETLADLAGEKPNCAAALSVPQAILDASTGAVPEVNYTSVSLGIASRYAQIYAPFLVQWDPDNGKNVEVAPDGVYGGLLAKAFAAGKPWNPIANEKGIIDNVVGITKHYTEAEADLLVDNSINVILNIEGLGIRIWSALTLDVQSSKYSRQNVQFLINYIVPQIKILLTKYLNRLNTTEERSSAKTEVESFMERVKAEGGVYGFAVQCDDNNNPQSEIDAFRMNVGLTVNPTSPIEEIFVNLTVTNEKIIVVA